MNPESFALLGTAMSIGLLHTLAGPDHYLPFVALSKAKAWSPAKTLAVVALCGLGHVLGSVALGLAGVALGTAVSEIEVIEGIRGSLAAWLLFVVGLLYAVWGIYRAFFGKGKHQHLNTKRSISFWLLFSIFVFGPCEPLIPLLMYPAAAMSTFTIFLVVLAFAGTTIGTMLCCTYSLLKGISLLNFNKLERYQHALAGGTLGLCGAGMLFWGL